MKTSTLLLLAGAGAAIYWYTHQSQANTAAPHVTTTAIPPAPMQSLAQYLNSAASNNFGLGVPSAGAAPDLMVG